MARRSPRRFSCRKEVTVQFEIRLLRYSIILRTSSSRVCLRSSCEGFMCCPCSCISCFRVSLPCSFALRFLYITWLRIKHENCHTDECQDGRPYRRNGVIECYEETDGERCSGSDEPTADNAEYTRNAEYRRITSPGTVGKRCTHGYHKGDVGGGKGKFQGSSQGDEQTSQYEVDGGADQGRKRRRRL